MGASRRVYSYDCNVSLFQWKEWMRSRLCSGVMNWMRSFSFISVYVKHRWTVRFVNFTGYKMAGLCSKSHLISGYVYPPTSTSAKEWEFKSYLYFCIGLSRSYSNSINFFSVTFGRVGTLNPTIFDIEPESTQKNSFLVTVKNSELNIK